MVAKLLLITLVEMLVFMTLFFVYARRQQRIDTVDLAWATGFAVVAWTVVLLHPTLRSGLVAVLVSIWGYRLASHIWERRKFRGDDPRYQAIIKNWKGDIWRRAYYSIYLLQGVLLWLVSLPIILLANTKLNGANWLIFWGTVIWITGFVIESIADRQLQDYLKKKRRPKVMETGLWFYSRHPNYFGELTQWWGIGVIALCVSFGWIGLVGPLLLTYLIMYVSGVPLIEERRKDDKAYQLYKQRTSVIIPWPPRI